MPFNSATYNVNKWRRQRSFNMRTAREARRAMQLAESELMRSHYEHRMHAGIRLARLSNMMLRSAIRYKAIKTAPVEAFMPGGRYYEEPNT
jgi:hypothetical protein